MDKKEREAIRARSEAAINTYTQVYGESSIWFEIQQDIYVLLDALDEADKLYAETLQALHTEMTNANVFAADVGRYQTLWNKEQARADKAEWEAEETKRALNKVPGEFRQAMADLDRWKARAETLERAIKSIDEEDENSIRCRLCVNYGACTNCNNYSEWEFDEARFAEEAGNG